MKNIGSKMEKVNVYIRSSMMPEMYANWLNQKPRSLVDQVNIYVYIENVMLRLVRDPRIGSPDIYNPFDLS